MMLARPLALLGLDDRGARSLGLGLMGAKFASLAVAVWLAASVTAEVGVIGFVGLAGPAFARLAGARTSRQVMTLAPIAGAMVLSLTDSVVQILGTGGRDLAPTGAATALLGGPLLLYLLPKVHALDPVCHRVASAAIKRLANPKIVLFALIGLTVGLTALTPHVGRTSRDGIWLPERSSLNSCRCALRGSSRRARRA